MCFYKILFSGVEQGNVFPNITEATQKFVGISWYTNSGVISFDNEATAAQIA